LEVCFLVRHVKYSLELLIPKKDLVESNDILTTFFGTKWLNGNNKNPLQLLWQRNDLLAKAERYSLGNSIETIKNKNPDWVKQKVERIKSNERGNIFGAVFEILASAMFERGSNHEVIFPPSDNPGIDFIVRFKDGANMNVSCKNHRKSNNSINFDKESEKFKERFVNFCKGLNLNIQCLIFSNKFPKHREWQILNKSISDILLSAFDNGISNKYQSFKEENWTINIGNFSNYEKLLSKFGLSYNLMIFARFHQNELENLRGHLIDGLDNLSEYGPDQNEDNINIIYVNLGDNYSLDYCEEIGMEYLKENKNKPIAGLYFQKGYPTHDSTKFDTIYSYRLVKNDFYDIWNSDKDDRIVNLSSPIASEYTLADTERSLLTEKEGIIEKLPLNNDLYFYHKGELYLKYDENHFNKSATPGLQINLVKKTKDETEIHFIDTSPKDEFILL